MAELVLAITGINAVNEDEASDLLDDLVSDVHPERIHVLISDDEDNEALGIIDSWLDDSGISYEAVPDNRMVRTLLTFHPVADMMLIVLGIPGSEEIIQQALDAAIEVSDLSKALFTVEQDDLVPSVEMVLEGPVVDGDAMTKIPGGTGWPEITGPEDGSESRTWTREEILEIVAGYVKSNEVSGRTAMPAGVGVTDMPVKNLDGEILCYRNTRSGMTRVAGRGKKKPNDEEVYLTQAEIDAL